eukprot:194892_1
MTNLLNYDLFPFIKTTDNAPTCPISVAFICIFGTICWNFVYSELLEMFSSKRTAKYLVSLLYAIWVSFASINMIINDDNWLLFSQKNKIIICGNVERCQWIFSISLSYFLWELYLCVKNRLQFDLFIHAIFCILVHSIGLITHSMHRWGILVSLYSLSTIPMCIYIFLYHYGYNLMAFVFQQLFLISFVLSRFGIGGFVTFEIVISYFNIQIFG